MFTHVMNLTMNAAIFREGSPGREPMRATPKKPKAVAQRARRAVQNSAGNKAPATFQIYADAFKTAVYGG